MTELILRTGSILERGDGPTIALDVGEGFILSVFVLSFVFLSMANRGAQSEDVMTWSEGAEHAQLL